MMLGAAVSGTATYLTLRKLQGDQSEKETELPVMLFGHLKNRNFDDLNRIFDGVESDLGEP